MGDTGDRGARARWRIDGGGHRAAAVGVLVAAWGPAVTALVLMGVASAPWTQDQWFFVVDTVDALVYGLVAAVVLSRRRHPVAWLVALTAIGGGVAAVTAQAVALWARDAGEGAVPPQWTILQSTAWVPGTLSLILVVPYLVSGRRLSPVARWAIGAGTAVIVAVLALRLTDPWPWPAYGEPYAPLAVRSTAWARLAEPLNQILLGLIVLLGLGAAAHTGWRRMRDPGARGLGWLAIGTALIAVTFLPLVLWPTSDSTAVLLFTPFTHIASQAFFPAAVLVAVLRQRLWGIDLAVSRTLVWSLLTGMLVAGYFVTVAVLGLVLPGEGALGRVLATAVPAVGIQPARSWLQRRVDRLVHGEAAAPALSRVGRHLGSAAGLEEALTGMAESVAVSFNLGSVRVLDADGEVLVSIPPEGLRDRLPEGPPDGPWDGLPGGPRAESRDGPPQDLAPAAHGTPLAVPLVVRQESAGTLLVTARPGERLDRRARSALEEVAPIVATAVHLAAVTRALRESRGRLAAARDDERRALRRELHDQLGPALAGIGLGLAAVRNLLPDRADAADALLGRLRAEVDVRVDEVRTLARGLVPPVLAELGLVAALRELVMRYEADGLAVVVRDGAGGGDSGGDSGDGDRENVRGGDGDRGRPAYGDLPAKAAGAVYAIVAEALRNVSRHSGARTCAVVLAGTGSGADRVLTVVVEDDGHGIAAGARSGVGRQSVQERAEEVGGTVVWEPGAGGRGTRLILRVPLREELTDGVVDRAR
ncbi:histidine kinase [Streptomyces sp. NBC_00872]|uniref:sensor histidine kinase n=1 Tax=Streptomyces sp. NBC_00872 TaxID=2903686 RepID=UPI00386A94C4|nr:histidine kinase [Streptomyces sp. NBC_00872]